MRRIVPWNWMILVHKKSKYVDLNVLKGTSTNVVYSLGLLQYLLEIRGGQRPMIANFFTLTG